MGSKSPKLLSVTETARKLGISRTHVQRKIQRGEIIAQKVGRNYVIRESDLPTIHRPLSVRDKRQVDVAVQRALREYGDIIRRLGDA